MERYLRYCLDSLLIKINLDKLEVLIINDGSKDSSLSIALEYESKYPETFIVINKENGNYGSCINKGLSIATGKYIKVLDADDSFDTANFEEFVSYLMTIDADLVLSDFAVVNEERKETSHCSYDFPVNHPLEMSCICNTDSFIDMQMHAVTYKRENLMALDYRQTEGISYTDQQWIFIPMISVRTVFNFDKIVYKYLVGRAGQTMNSNVRMKSLGHLMKCMLSLVDDYNKYSDKAVPEQIKYFLARLIPQIKDIYISVFSICSEQIEHELIKFDNDLHQKNKDIYILVEGTNASFNYIKFWRNNRWLPPVIIKIITQLYLKLKYVG